MGVITAVFCMYTYQGHVEPSAACLREIQLFLIVWSFSLVWYVALGLQVYKECLLGDLKYINRIYVGLGLVQHQDLVESS